MGISQCSLDWLDVVVLLALPHTNRCCRSVYGAGPVSIPILHFTSTVVQSFCHVAYRSTPYVLHGHNHGSSMPLCFLENLGFSYCSTRFLHPSFDIDFSDPDNLAYQGRPSYRLLSPTASSASQYQTRVSRPRQRYMFVACYNGPTTRNRALTQNPIGSRNL